MSEMVALSVPITIDGLDHLIREELGRLSCRRERDAVLESDEAFDAFCEKHSELRFGPFVRAATYSSLGYQQDIWSRYFGNDTRRPVVMKGAKARLQSRYETKSAWAHLIAERYLLRIKFTAFTPDETDKMSEIISDHMRRRGHYVHSNDCVSVAACGSQNAAVYIDGKFRRVTPEEWRRLKKLHSQKYRAPKCEKGPKLTLRQRKTAAYQALKELGIQF